MTLSPGKPSALARHGLLLVTALLGMGLLAMSWSSYHNAEALADILVQGQIEFFLRSVRAHSRPRPLDDEAWRAYFAEHEANGLRGIIFVEPDGSPYVVAGSMSDTPIDPRQPRDGPTPQRVAGGRFRSAVPPPADRPPLVGDARPGPMRPLFLEFEPTFAARHLERARAMLALGTGASLLLVAVAAVLWRRARREEELTLRLLQSERLAGLGTVSAVLAHEIKNPLAALKGNAQLVAENLPEGSRPRAQADRVVHAAVRLEDLVHNLLDFARGGPLQRARVDPAEILHDAAEAAAPRAHLELDAAPEAWSLDALHMRQVLANLLRNAAQATGDEERVWASVSVEGGRLLFLVRDDGPGLPEGAAEAIFEPFFTTRTRGVGLGLAVARRIVVQHGGQITARNLREGGAEFRVSIPSARI